MKSIFSFIALLTSVTFNCIAGENPGPTSSEVIVSNYDGNQLTLDRFAAQGNELVIWINGDSWEEREILTAQTLAQHGIEVWQIDFSEALMQTSSSSLLRNLDAEYVADIIDAAHKQTGKRVMLMAQSFAAIPALGGATLWQQHKTHHGKLSGAILFSPDLSTALPALGKDPEYLPIARATNIPMMIYQGSLHGPQHQFMRMFKELNSNNPNVFYNMLANTTSVFYHDQDNEEILSLLKVLPAKILELFNLFESLQIKPSKTVYTPSEFQSNIRPDSKLKEYRGNTAPITIDLHDSTGKHFHLENYRGKVTVVNFWATWCPPCVEEIPSLNRLREQMRGLPFELITVNYAQSTQTIQEFMHKVDVQFPVLIDPKGATAQKWNVIGFPSTFVIGPDGKIRYGVNAAIHWDNAEVISALKALLP